MSNNSKKIIIHILIGVKSKPLAEYYLNDSKYSKACENQLNNCQNNLPEFIIIDDYKIYYINSDDIIYMIIVSQSFSSLAVISCLEKMKKEFGEKLHGRNFSAINNYGLNSELKEKLKNILEFYNEHPETKDIDEEVIPKYKNEIFKAAKELDERQIRLNEIMEKMKKSEEDSLPKQKSSKKDNKDKKCIIF